MDMMIDKIHKQNIREGIENGNLNDELLNNENIRIICCGSSPKNFEGNSSEWFYYNRIIFELEQKNLEKLYNVNVNNYLTEWIDKNGKLYGDDNYDKDSSYLYIIPSCIYSWSHCVNSTGYIYRSKNEIIKLAFEKPNRIIKEYIWSDDSNNVYRRFNRIMMEEHNKTINKNKEITESQNKINDLVR